MSTVLNASTVLNIALAVIGASIVGYCLRNLHLGGSLGVPQKFKGFGIETELSPASLYIVLGFSLMAAPLYLQYRDYENRVGELETTKRGLEQALQQAKDVHVRLLLEVEGATEIDIGKLSEWKCHYHIRGEGEPKRVDLLKGYDPRHFAILVTGVGPNTRVERITLEHLNTQRRWVFSEGLSPLEPLITLKPQP